MSVKIVQPRLNSLAPADIIRGAAKNVELINGIGDTTLTFANRKSGSETDSEKSYTALHALEDVQTPFIFLSFNTRWRFINTIVILVRYTIIMYMTTFDADVIKNPVIFTIFIVSSTLDAIDIISSNLHYIKASDRTRKIYHKKHFILFVLDILYATSIPVEMFCNYSTNVDAARFIFIMTIYRLYKCIFFCKNITASPLRQGIFYVLTTYTIILYIVIVTVTCIIMSIGCIKCDDGKVHWTDDINQNEGPFMLFAESLFITFAGFSSIGIGGASKRNDEEAVAFEAIMLFSLFIMNGMFLGTFTSVQIDLHKRRSLFIKHFMLIKQQLEVKRLNSKLKKKITIWYYNFWIKESGIKHSDVMISLPNSLNKDVELDKYWYAINQSHILRHTHIGFKREIALRMSTIYFNRGDTILQQDRTSSKMHFLAKGLIHIVAPDDIESPIITLGFGTCIGDIHLLLNTPIRANVTAASYCKMYVLDKINLWHAAVAYARLKPSVKIHETANFVLSNAKMQRQDSILRKNMYEKLKYVKMTLQTKLNEYSLNSNKVVYTLSQADVMDFYIIEKTEISTSGRDTIFVTNSWPWILYPKTQLTWIWEIIIILYTILLSIIYPYVIFFLSEKPKFYRFLLRPIAYVIYCADIILQIFTAVENEQQNLTIEVPEIVAKKFTNFIFIFDIISILPIDVVFGSTAFGQYFECNHMVKIIRVVMALNYLLTSFKFGTNLTKIFIYVIYLLYTSYIMGFIYYVSGCQRRPCVEESWITKYEKNQKNIDIHNESDKSIIVVSMLYGLLAISGTGGRFFVVTWIEKITLCVFFLVAIFLYTYLLADYSATLTLYQMVRDKFIYNVVATRKFIAVNKMKKSIINRVNSHMETQWAITNGILVQELMRDMPQYFYEKFNKGKYSNLLNEVPLFKLFSAEMILKLSAKSLNEYYPPNEYVVHSGSKTSAMYIIDKGYCLIKSPSHEKILGPKSSICVIDMLLGVPVLHTVRTLTNVSLLKISNKDLKSVLTIELALKQKIENVVQKTKNTMTVQRLFVKTNESLDSLDVKEGHYNSFFVFPNEKLHPLNIDYKKGWSGLSMLKYVLRRKTILPHSLFLYGYVIYYAIVIFLSCMIDPCIFIYKCFLPKYVTILMSLPLSVLGFLDVYIRMHVCYYNNEGILVTHPRFTALHYITTAFTIDVITSIPFTFFIDSFEEPKPLLFIIILVKIIKAYRVPNGFSYCNRDLLKTESILWNVCKYLILSIIMLNGLAGTLVLIGCEYKYVENTYVLEPYKNSWIYSKTLAQSAVEPGTKPHAMKIYLLALYYISAIMSQLGIGDVMVVTTYEIVYMIFVITYGFIWFTYILVYISNTKAVLNENLTMYQDYMKDLLVFLKNLGLTKVTQRKCIRHFEYLWQRTQGSYPKMIFKNLNVCLKGDCILNLYYDTFNSALMFQQLEISFYCQLGEIVEVLYYLHDVDIVNLHNIVDSVYIVHHGEVHINDASDKRVTTLGRGGIFGNLDNVPYSRSMISVKSNNAVDLLCVKTATFYDLLLKYPSVMYSFQEYLIRNNLAYITNVIKSEDSEDIQLNINRLRIKLSKLETHLMTRKVQLIFMLISFFSYMIVVYHASFQNHEISILVFTYILDVLHVLKIYLEFITPYINKVGEVVKNKALIKKRYLRQYNFYFDLFALMPIEILSLCFVSEGASVWMFISWFRLNRLLRLFNVNKFFSVTDEYLNINVLTIKLCSALVYFAVFLHTEACIWFVIACPNLHCDTAGWSYDPEFNGPACEGHYVCAIYYTTSILTCTGYSSIIPRSYVDVVASLVTVLLNKFVVSIFISNIAAIVRHYGHRLGTYTFDVSVYKNYLENGNISYMLQQRVMNYLDQLWYVSKGRQMPVFLDIGPNSLKEEINVQAFGNHIFSNVILYNCHIDFLRQLTNFLKMERYFNGDVICRQGDINEIMYFIHTGTVEVYVIGDKEEIHIDTLKQLDCFGMIQGLFPNVPHAHTYKCTSVTQVLSLYLRDWVHLLTFFPASKYTIYDSLAVFNENM